VNVCVRNIWQSNNIPQCITTTITVHLTKYCTEQRAIRRKAENVAVKQFPSVVLNVVIINVVIFITARHVVATEVIVDDTSLSTKPTRNITMPITTTHSQHSRSIRFILGGFTIMKSAFGFTWQIRYKSDII